MGPATKADLKNVSSAKKALLKKFSGRPWFRGAGIAPSKTGLKLRLNVTPEMNATAEEIPKQFRGFDVEVVFIDTYKMRQLG